MLNQKDSEALHLHMKTASFNGSDAADSILPCYTPLFAHIRHRFMMEYRLSVIVDQHYENNLGLSLRLCVSDIFELHITFPFIKTAEFERKTN